MADPASVASEAERLRGLLEEQRLREALAAADALLGTAPENRDALYARAHSLRRLLDHCGLGFEPACVAFHRTERSVRTASSEQVRQPLYRDALSQWRHFEPWLEPLRAALGDALTLYRE